MKATELQEILRRLNCLSYTQFRAVMLTRFTEESYIEDAWGMMHYNLARYVMEIDAELLQRLISYSQLT